MKHHKHRRGRPITNLNDQPEHNQPDLNAGQENQSSTGTEATTSSSDKTLNGDGSTNNLENGFNNSQTLTLEPDDTRRLANLCGQFNEHLKQIERRLNIEIRNRGNVFSLHGPRAGTEKAGVLLQNLYAEADGPVELTPDKIHLYLQSAGIESLMEDNQSDNDNVAAIPVIRTKNHAVKPRGNNQKGYVAAIRDHDISFGIGPAGTGKTYLAVACAVEALLKEQVERLLLVRPAVEAGEKLGFLPGDLAQKIDPYLRPLYDALYEMLGFDAVNKMFDKHIIEVAPLAYMRGRTLNNAFIILDESQNTTVAQMKMFLTRIGFGSTAVITGDTTQIDLPRGTESGLLHACKVLKSVDGIHFTRFNSKDVVRHPLVQRIVDAYEDYDSPSIDNDE